jgi:hypothetical protein
VNRPERPICHKPGAVIIGFSPLDEPAALSL